MTVSALTGDSLMEAWDAIAALDAARRRGGGHARRRRDQAVGWMRFELEQGLRAMLRADPAVRAMTPALERAVAEGAITPDAAAARALAAFARGAGG
jgi:LAO/AO transport system kinase